MYRMNEIGIRVSKSLLNFCTHQTLPLDIIKEGVKLLQEENLNGAVKKEVLIEIIRLFAYGDDKVQGTLDDRLSKETTSVLTMMIESGAVDLIIDGLVKGNFSVFRKCFKKVCG